MDEANFTNLAALFRFVGFGFYLFPLLKAYFGGVPDESANIWYYVFFVNNFDFINSGTPDSSVLGVLWSIAIEEQFYLLWPILLAIIPVRYYWIAFAIIIGISLIFRATHGSWIEHEIHTLSCIGDMAIGAFGAWGVQYKRVRNFIQEIRMSGIIALYVTMLVVFIFRDHLTYFNQYTRIFERIFIAVLILLVILEQNYAKHSMFKLGRYKLISKLGEISYGLYSLHFIGILIAVNITKFLGINTEVWQVLFLETALALLITIALSMVSYKILEQPFLKLKRRFSYSAE